MRVILFFFIFLTSYSLNSQTTFNKRFDFGYDQSLLTGIIITDSCYYGAGIIGDTISPFNTGNIFVKFDLDGNVLFHKVITSPIKSYEVWEAPIISTMDGGFLASGLTIGNGFKSILIKYNSEGDTVFIKIYDNPFYPEETFTHPLDVIEAADGGYLSLNLISMIGPSFTGIQLIKFDAFGNEVWQQIYDSEKWERAYEITADDDGGYLIGAWRTNLNEDNNNFISQSWIIKTDSLGEVVWEYLSPLGQLEQGAWDIQKTVDGGYVVASGWGFERYVNPGSGRLLFDGYFFKLDSSLTKVWDVVIRGNAQTENDRYTRMVAASDGSGYVACGSQQIIFDINGELVGGFQGWLTKVSPEGDSLWNRYLSFVNPDKNHTFYDLEETPDGGFLLCGEVKDLSAPVGEPVLAAWLVKVDEYGCVVPGCHLSTSLDENSTRDIRLSIFPNPSSDYLNIYTRLPEGSKDAEFRIVNTLGREVLRFTSTMSEVTHVVPVFDYAAGIYYLQYFEKGVLLKSEEFVVVK